MAKATTKTVPHNRIRDPRPPSRGRQPAYDISELTRAAKQIRAAADAAAADTDEDRACCWGTQRTAHQESVIETRIDADGHDTHQVIAVPVIGQIAAHIGLWGPNTARAIAAWLESAADLHEAKPHPCGSVAHAADGCGCVLSSCQWCNDEDDPCSDIRHALEVAREILGTKHEGLRSCTSEPDTRAANLALVQ